MINSASRRGFLKGASAASVALVVGVHPDGTLAAASSQISKFGPFVKIDATGAVTAIVKHYETGQGVSTGLSTLIAEEIGLRIDRTGFEFAPSNPDQYNNLRMGPIQGTGNSTAIAFSWAQYRQAGAAAREMLITAAAGAWGMDVSEITIDEGIVTAIGHSWTPRIANKIRYRSGGSPLPKIAFATFGYKSHISIDRRYGLIREQAVRSAAHTDGKMLRRLKTTDNTDLPVQVDSAYRSKANEA